MIHGAWSINHGQWHKMPRVKSVLMHSCITCDYPVVLIAETNRKQDKKVI